MKNVCAYNPAEPMRLDPLRGVAPRAPLELRRVPAPKPAPGGAILEMVASEVGTDVHLTTAARGRAVPIVPATSAWAVLGTQGR
jgi:hypothetical protein